MIMIRVECTVKDEFIPVIDRLFDKRNWKDVIVYHPEHSFLKGWAELEKSNDIPFRSNSPYGTWEHRLIYNGNIWRFEAESDHYHTIYFIYQVLSRMAAKINVCNVQWREGVNEVFYLDHNNNITSNFE